MDTETLKSRVWMISPQRPVFDVPIHWCLVEDVVAEGDHVTVARSVDHAPGLRVACFFCHGLVETTRQDVL